MDHFLLRLFSLVCEQNPEHTWAPAGELLPLCQRCTGFYIGAAVAFILLFLFRPEPGSRYRWLHTTLVLAMIPFGFHLVRQEALIRTLSGQWFGMGVVGLLWIFPGRNLLPSKRIHIASNRLHLGLGLASFLLLPVLARWGGTPAAIIIPGLAFMGMLSLAYLTAANAALFIRWLLSPLLQRKGQPST